MKSKATAAQIRKIETLCGKTEALQAEINEGSQHLRDCLRAAKDSLLEALRAAESGGVY